MPSSPNSASHLPPSQGPVYTDLFADSHMMMLTAQDQDPLSPQREAAFFYGLFLRGHSLEDLRQDIDIPRKTLDKWLRAKDFENTFIENLQRVYNYRKQVLAVFDALVSNEQNRLQ